MGERYDAMTPRPKGDGGTWWHKVGSAWKNDKGLVTVFLDSVPVPDPDKDNKIVIMLFEPRDPQQSGPSTVSQQSRQSAAPQRSMKEEMDDEIPF